MSNTQNSWIRVISVCIGLMLMAIVISSCSTSSSYQQESLNRRGTNDNPITVQFQPSHGGKVTVPMALELSPPDPKAITKVPVEVEVQAPTVKPVNVPVRVQVESSKRADATKLPVEMEVKIPSVQPLTVPMNVVVENKTNIGATRIPVEISVESRSTNVASLPLGVVITATNAGQDINVPFKLRLATDDQAVIAIPVSFRPASVSSEPITVQVALSFTNNLPQYAAPVVIAPNSAGSAPNAPQYFSTVRLITVIIVFSGLIGSLIRSLGDYAINQEGRMLAGREYVDRVAESVKNASGNRKDILEEFVKRIKRLDNEYALKCILNFFYGLLASSLVPALLTVVDSPIIDKIGENPGYLAALWGFCLVAGTLGAVFFNGALGVIWRSLFQRHAND